ncbi:hypothetical protein DICPUDRAFT_28377 [Dictyostelium purpureum]|uniref:Pseudouridine synthase RsuA/RluA-like domain-containing protein n=1 Tax=Dictyostelium purpureum TaxID=5786 RepID=F0ZBU9_DICPU|nr:uncharacterized protein DICPUDRAFT_28377 [Dictyostelium purpureum]EGC38603.1 hypothetical protein DICPUDRAFT_28377 [Dictyostelium purpureum]|eukprot:XP_003284882.1 hypothetical protein DICPUDRAFT_28377 [Dictyostelium purpureum]
MTENPNKKIKLDDDSKEIITTVETTVATTTTILKKINYLGRTPPSNPIFKVIFKSDDYCLVNKPYDVNIDDDGKDRNETVVKYLENEYPEVKGSIRFVNRIDYATSGIVVTALNKKSANKGMELFQNRDTTKTYLAIVHGHIESDEGLIDKPIANDKSDLNSFKMCIGDKIDNPGRSSQTNYKVLERGHIKRFKKFSDNLKLLSYNNSNNNGDNNSENNSDNNKNNDKNDNIQNEEIIEMPVTKVLLTPKSGRRHQLRVHLQSIGHIIVGDETYGPKDPQSERMMLHSWKLILPFKNEPQINVETDDPFKEILIK